MEMRPTLTKRTTSPEKNATAKQERWDVTHVRKYARGCTSGLDKPEGDAEAVVSFVTAKFAASSSKTDRLKWWKTRYERRWVGDSDGSIEEVQV